MVIKMYDSKLKDIKEVREFLEKSKSVKFEKMDRKEAYEWIERILKKFEYLTLGKRNKTVVKRYMEKMTGYSRAQVTNLVTKFRDTGEIKVIEYERHKFERKYMNKDIRLLAKTTELHEYPNGAAVKRNLHRESDIYGKEEYKRISEISVSHIYNLRKTVTFQRAVTYCHGTKKSKAVGIGKRIKPNPNGKPGYIRVDSVEQGSTKAGGGVYHINAVDEVLQWEVTGAVETLIHENLVPLLRKIIESYPYKIINFHTDNGSEYINQYVAKLLNELLIKLTKSRPRHSNDNALAETKNTVVRKWIGYGYIHKKYANELNKFYYGSFNEYLNFHHPCAFAVEKIDRKGKVRKQYLQENYMTPYEKLKSLPESKKYLKEEITFEKLDKIAMRYTDNEMAEKVQDERRKLFDKILSVA